jgi:hypothetical protein
MRCPSLALDNFHAHPTPAETASGRSQEVKEGSALGMFWDVNNLNNLNRHSREGSEGVGCQPF